MKRPLNAPPDPFSLSPLLSLLPVRGTVGGLAALTTSFFARLEKVEALHHELLEGEDRELRRRFAAEEAMLKQVLEWLEIHPGGPK